VLAKLSFSNELVGGTDALFSELMSYSQRLRAEQLDCSIMGEPFERQGEIDTLEEWAHGAFLDEDDE
jgi:hypothetical protein